MRRSTAPINDVLRRPAVAAIAVAAVLAGAGTAAANDWLPLFETGHITPVGFRTTDLVALPDLSDHGELVVTRDTELHAVPDAAAAAAETGLDLPEPASLPTGVSGAPVYQVVGEVTATFTVAADRATGAGAAPAPPGLDGSAVRMQAGPGAAAIWSRAVGLPSLVVGRAVAPTATSSGVAFEVVRDHLLSIPGLPADVAAQLRTFTGDGSTLPLPVPADHLTTSTATVHGRPATVVSTRDRSLSAVFWLDDGVVTAVAGAFTPDEVVAIARDLR